MTRDEAEKLVNDFRNSHLEHYTIYNAKREALIQALTTPATVPSEAIKPGRRYLVTRTITQECEIRQGIDGTGLWVRHINYSGSSVGWSLPLSVLVDKGAIFEPIDTKEPV